LVTGDLLGQYRSAFRGSGLIFSDLREYQPGDDIKHIHWKATARTGTVFVKSYEEDRQLRVMLAVDTSSSMRAAIGQQSFSKALEFCALIGSFTQRGNDLLGLQLFADKPGIFLPPKSGSKSFSRILSSLSEEYTQSAPSTDTAAALDHISVTVKKPSIVFVVSDFECADFSDALRRLGTRHDVILAQIQPSLENLPRAGLVTFRDAESGEVCCVDTSSKAVQRAWGKALELRRSVTREIAKQSGADHFVITDSASRPLIQLMKERVKRISR
jgi:uncharacterized protein (DUF58 family)